jgi:hypothetical protein
LIFNGLHGFILHKLELFITIVVRTLNPTSFIFVADARMITSSFSVPRGLQITIVNKIRKKYVKPGFDCKASCLVLGKCSVMNFGRDTGYLNNEVIVVALK